MSRLDADFVSAALNAPVRGLAPEEPFSGVSTDSRAMAPGRLFVALSGPRFDGHDYLAAAFQAGAAGAVVRRGITLPEMPEACLFPVEDTQVALGDLAGAWRREHTAGVAALTGSNGKTTTKEMLAAILDRRHRVLKNRGNFNNLIGLPLTLMELSEAHTACVLEMGMSAPGEIARLTNIAAPDVGLVTNVGSAHLGPMGSLKAVAAAKAELYQGLTPGATAVVNLDDPHLSPWAGRLSLKVVGFGLDALAQVRGSDLSALGSRQAFTLTLPGLEPFRVRLSVPGRHNVSNALAAAAAAWALNLGPEDIQGGLESFTPVGGRLTLTWCRGGPLLIDDTYNANPSSLAGGLDALADVAGGRPTALILGDMKELGPTTPELHLRAGQAAAAAGCQVVLALGDMAGQVAEGARRAGLDQAHARSFEDLYQLMEAAQELLHDRFVVLVKGSRSMKMERVVGGLCMFEWEGA